MGHLSQPTPCWARRRLLCWGGSIPAASPQNWSGSRHKPFPHLVLTWNLAVDDPNFLASSCPGPARTKFPFHGLWHRRYRSWKLPLSVRCPRVCIAMSPVQWLELPWACGGGGVLGSEGAVGSVLQLLPRRWSVCICLQAPEVPGWAPLCSVQKLFALPFREVSFPEVSPVILEITHSRGSVSLFADRHLGRTTYPLKRLRC